jgi:hypothetical protein
MPSSDASDGNIVKHSENPAPAASNDGYFQIIMLTNITGHLKAKIDEEKCESSKGICVIVAKGRFDLSRDRIRMNYTIIISTCRDFQLSNQPVKNRVRACLKKLKLCKHFL